MKKVLLSWSSGKDSAWSLGELRRDPEVELVGLLTTLNSDADRVAMHAVRRELLRAQAEAAGLPVMEIDLPWPCSNDDYEKLMADACAQAVAQGVSHIAFGDLFLPDVREYREQKLQGTGLQALFPLWGQDTRELSAKMVAAGLKAVLTCVDPKQLDPAFAGREYDAKLLAELPAGVDPCGENGEFHSFVYAGPMFRHEIPIERGEVIERDGFWFADVTPAD